MSSWFAAQIFPTIGVPPPEKSGAAFTALPHLSGQKRTNAEGCRSFQRRRRPANARLRRFRGLADMVGRTSSLLSRDIEFQVKALSVPLSLIRRMSGLDRDGFLIWLFFFGSLMGFGLGNPHSAGLRSHFGDRPRAHSPHRNGPDG